MVCAPRTSGWSLRIAFLRLRCGSSVINQSQSLGSWGTPTLFGAHCSPLTFHTFSFPRSASSPTSSFDFSKGEPSTEEGGDVEAEGVEEEDAEEAERAFKEVEEGGRTVSAPAKRLQSTALLLAILATRP